MRPRKLEPAALEALMAYDWRRNNVRELRNVIERMLIATDREELTRDDVPAEIRDRKHAVSRSSHAPPRSFEEQKQEAERQIVIQALERNDWHVTKTAKELGLSDHASLLKIMRRLGVQRDT
jgi:two-component system nitrogen regulation response regulator NtrX